MKGKLETELGDVQISEDAIATLAGSIAIECFGIVGMATVGLSDGIAQLLKRESLQKGIEVDVDSNNEISLKFHIIAAYGVSITAVAKNLFEVVRYKVEAYTGMKVNNIEVFVEGVKPID